MTSPIESLEYWIASKPFHESIAQWSWVFSEVSLLCLKSSFLILVLYWTLPSWFPTTKQTNKTKQTLFLTTSLKHLNWASKTYTFTYIERSLFVPRRARSWGLKVVLMLSHILVLPALPKHGNPNIMATPLGNIWVKHTLNTSRTQRIP